MTVLTHAIIGAGLALNQESLSKGFLLGIASHFILDRLPHNDYIYFFVVSKSRKRVHLSILSIAFIILTIVTLAYLFVVTGNPKIIVGALGAILPDLITGVFHEMGFKPSFFDKFHFFMHLRQSLAERFLEGFDKISVKRAFSFEDAYYNFQLIKSRKWGRIGWISEILIEITLTSIFLYGISLKI